MLIKTKSHLHFLDYLITLLNHKKALLEILKKLKIEAVDFGVKHEKEKMLGAWEKMIKAVEEYEKITPLKTKEIKSLMAQALCFRAFNGSFPFEKCESYARALRYDEKINNGMELYEKELYLKHISIMHK